jgi:hydrogenase maturation protein HypF
LDRPVETTLAVGAHLKNSVALAVGQDVFISQHIGDLETTQATQAFERVIDDFQRLYDATPTVVVCDTHPDYLSTRYAEATGLPVHKVQHHIAHVYACMAENGITGPALGVSWDGTGYGDDGTVWGGEFIRVPGESGQLGTRVAHMRTFQLPGGDKAVKEPRRSAIGVLHELLGDRILSRRKLPALWACTPEEVQVWSHMIATGVNAPVTSSVGRLFDAVASILGICHHSTFEGQAAMQVEFATNHVKSDERYGFKVLHDHTIPDRNPLVVDWASTIYEIILDLYFETPIAQIAVRFQNTLAEMIVEVARLVGEQQVVLTGGCFQNVYLTERTVCRLQEEGFRPYLHQRVPPNDGGIALGQIVAAARLREEEE